MTIKFQNDKHYEERIVQALIVDHSWAEQMIEVLDLNYFNKDYLKEAARILFDYYHEYDGAFPSFKLLATMVKKIESEVLRDQIIKYLIKIKKEPLNGDLEYIKETALDFCKKRSLAIALESSLDLIQNKKYDQIISTIQKAILAGSDRDIGHLYVDHFEKRMTVEQRKPIPVPWKEVCDVMNGGLSAGELGIIMAVSGAGKTHSLIDIGYHVAGLGYNVVHYTFELSDILVGKRYDARASNIPFNNLLDHKERVKEKINDIKGKIVIKSFPIKRATVMTLKNHFNQLVIRDMKPDVMMVDYGDIMKSIKNYDQKRLEEEAIFEELRSLAQELGIPIWTATQSNREGMDVEVLTLKHVAECFGKAMIADFFMTMTRKKESGDSSIGNFFIAKSRLGHDGLKFPMMINTALSRIDLIDPEDLEDDGGEEVGTIEVLKKQYQKFNQSYNME